MSTKDVSSKENSDIPTLGKTPPMLSYFCVYNPSLSQSEENTKDQILYYTAKKVVPADVKMKQVGLAQALVSVASTFSTTEVTQNVHSQKNRMVFLQPEPGFWMHMCIELGILRRQIKDQKGKEKLVTEYLDTELNDQALSAVLEIGYEQFKLLNGTMSSLLYGEDSLHQTPNRHRTRTLMLAIEEFFSTWIWLWDFDKLDTMVFGAVFNGVPSQPVLRSNYLNIYDLDNAIQKHFDQHINHLLVLDDDGSLIYRSPSLDLIDVRALRKYIIKRVESHIINAEEMEKKQKEKDITAKKEKGSTTLKSLTKSFSQVHILNYFTNKSFTSAPATPVSTSLNEALDNVANNDLPTNDDTPSTDISEPSPADEQEINHHGKFLTGMIEVNIEDLNGEERIVTRPDIVHVYINSQPTIENHEDGDDNESENGYIGLTEYILIIYKDNNNLTWSFLLPSFIQEVDDLVKDIDFYTSLEKFMMEQKLNDITESVLENIKDIQERSLTLGKHYKCFFYDNATLNMKSTMVDQQGRVMARAVPTTNSGQRQGQFVGGLPMSNEILLQLLNVKYDFETIPHTEEVYTRSTVNHWIVGKRVYNSSTPFPSSIKNIIRPIINKNKIDKQQHESDMDSHEAPPDDSPIEENIPFNPSDYSEIYLVAAKKDVSLADIEENIHKVTKTLTEVLHID